GTRPSIDPASEIVEPPLVSGAAAGQVGRGPGIRRFELVMRGHAAFSVLTRVWIEASGGQAIELADLPVECPGGNKAAKSAHASGGRAGGVPQPGLRVGRCRHDGFGDSGRIV